MTILSALPQLTPTQYPDSIKVFTAATHEEAIKRADRLLRHRFTQAAIWFREPESFDPAAHDSDRDLWQQTCAGKNIPVKLQKRQETSSQFVGHYDFAAKKQARDYTKAFLGLEVRVLILRSEDPKLSTILFDTKRERHYGIENLCDLKSGCEAWQATSNAAVFIKGDEWGKTESIFHSAAPFKGNDYARRHIDVLDLNPAS